MARFLVWYGFLGGAAAWSTQLVVGYGLEESLCSAGPAQTWTIVITVAAAAVAAGSIAASSRGLGSREGSTQLLAFAGMIAGAFFLVLIALGGLQLLSLESCSQG